MSQTITASDHFCGLGGASTGLIAAGVEVRDAANHWPVACNLYQRNHPETRVHCADLSATNPRRFPRTDLAWFSPDCRTFSMSAPSDANRMPELFDESPDSNVARSRVGMLDVVKFIDHHRYDVVMVENVVEITRKFPVDWWYGEIEKMGYDFKVLSINSMVCWPTPQSRDRWYACFWKKGNRAPDFELRPKSWCPGCEADVEAYQWFKRPPKGDPRAQCGKYGPRAQYLYKCSRCQEPALPYVWPAMSALDLSLPCPRIGDRETPLAPATRRRIEVGLERFGPGAVVQAAGNCFEREGYYRTWPLWRPLNSLTATLEYGVAVNTHQAGSPAHYDGSRVYPLEGAFPTQTGQTELGFAMVPLGHGETGPRATPAQWPQGTQTGRAETGVMAVPAPEEFMVTLRNHGRSYSPMEPTAAMTADGNHHWVVDPNAGMMVRMNGDLDDAPSMASPWNTASGTITGAANQGVVPFLTQYNGQGGSSDGRWPVPTQTGADRHGVVDPGSITVDDCGFRMMEPPEAKLGMGFGHDTIVEGSKRVQVKLCGQAVTPPVSGFIGSRAVAALTP